MEYISHINEAFNNLKEVQKQESVIKENITKLFAEKVHSEIKFKNNNIHGLFVVLSKYVSLGKEEALKMIKDLLDNKFFELDKGSEIMALELSKLLEVAKENKIATLVEGDKTTFMIEFVDSPEILSEMINGLNPRDNVVQFKWAFEKADVGYKLSYFDVLYGEQV